MAVDHYTHLMDDVRVALVQLLQPVEYLATAPRLLYESYTEAQTDVAVLRRRLAAAEAENLLLRSQLLQMEDLKAENRRLRLLLDASGRLPVEKTELMIATVLRYGSGPFENYAVINKGTLDGIRPNSPVIDPAGIFGLITETAALTSRVRLLTDPDLAIPVRIERTGQRAITQGLGHGRVLVRFLRKGADIQVGDLLVTSGLGNIYPPGYPVARISAIDFQRDAVFLHVIAQPVSQLYNNDEVLVLKMHHEDTPAHD